ncbi:unnamed protein product [Soboliphyme baturini]|uniref:Proton-coupled zinc antiporter SLC30A5 n=1 Tax=Soboliphyme baturini TaxID=241478 RepID=A0A183IUG7_9BILA|nr:unnamed protein product [Soboliphyme baturini]
MLAFESFVCLNEIFRTVYCAVTLAVFKLLKCVGVFIISSLLENIHVISLLFLVKLSTAVVMIILHRPFTSEVSLSKSQWRRVVQHAVVITLSQILWFYGITLCGPLRSILVYEHSTTVVLAALSAAFLGSGGSSRLRGAMLFAFGFLSLILLDRDVTLVHEHGQRVRCKKATLRYCSFSQRMPASIGTRSSASRRPESRVLPPDQLVRNSGSQGQLKREVVFVVVFMFGLFQAGVFVLALALLLRACADNVFKRLLLDIGGTKRATAFSSLLSAVLLFPAAVVVFFCKKNVRFRSLSFNRLSLVVFGMIFSQVDVPSWLMFLTLLTNAVFLVFLCDFYVENALSKHVRPIFLSRYCPCLMFVLSFVISKVWFEPYRSISPLEFFVGMHIPGPVEHRISGGVLFTLVLFVLGKLSGGARPSLIIRLTVVVLASINLTTPVSPKATAAQFVGYSSSGLPLYVYGEDFLQKTSQSIALFVKNTLRQILSNRDSTKIFYFLCLNLCFTFVEFAYGAWTNSLGLISDAFHMLFDCSALVMGLVASVMSTYGRLEILSGFVNALFLVIIASFIFFEGLLRIFDPPEVYTEKLLVGCDHDEHPHGHSHNGGSSHLPSHTHSHTHSHGHSHSGNANMKGVFLHVMADTLGSVAVIISSVLIQKFGWLIADPICSLLLSLLIAASVIPLLRDSAAMLLLHAPEEIGPEVDKALQSVGGVLKLKSENGVSHQAHSFDWRMLYTFFSCITLLHFSYMANAMKKRHAQQSR